jgi:hypothetical protein
VTGFQRYARTEWKAKSRRTAFSGKAHRSNVAVARGAAPKLRADWSCCRVSSRLAESFLADPVDAATRGREQGALDMAPRKAAVREATRQITA